MHNEREKIPLARQRRNLIYAEQRTIEYFVTLAECLSFTQAAAAHSVSQTAISQYIASLEAKLQVRLFNRNAHAVSLTDAGKFFYERVTFMLRYESDTKKRLIAIAEQYSGYVKVGIGMYESRHTEDFFSPLSVEPTPEIKVGHFPVHPYWCPHRKSSKSGASWT